MSTIQAIYEQGVFRPTVPVDLPEQTAVEFELRLLGNPADPAHLNRVHAILARRFASGEHDVAETCQPTSDTQNLGNPKRIIKSDCQAMGTTRQV